MLRRTARILSTNGYPAPPRPRRPPFSISSRRSSTGRSRAFATAPPASVSRRRGAVLAGKGGLVHVMDLVLVQSVVGRWWRLLRPDAGDAEVSCELAPTARD